MKNIVGCIYAIVPATYLFVIILSCNNNESAKKEIANRTKIVNTKQGFTKPPTIYTDTLIINFPAAVFFQPDSIQLSGINAQTDSMIFDGSMHEYFYQMRNARMVIIKTWPLLSIIESEKYKYLLFIQKDNTREYIDLDTIKDTHGVFVFNGKKSPLIVDMTNIETEISFYLKE